MKHLFTIALATVLCVTLSKAQIIPNGGFENWTGNNFPHPVSWFGTDSATAGFGVSGTIQKSTDAHSGSFAVRSEAKYLSAFGSVVPGLCTTGDIDLLAEEVYNGPAYTERPDSIVGWYKFDRVNDDTMYIQLILLDANDDTVGFANYRNIVPTTSYKRFSHPINYYNTSNPAYGHVIMRHSTSTASNPIGSVMIIDDLEVVFKPAGIDDATKPAVKIYPNPAKNFLMLDNPTAKGLVVSIYDAIGRKVVAHNLPAEQKQIDFQLADGVYIVEVKQNDKVVKLEKLVVQH